MRNFILFSCLFGCALAAPQQGYNYAAQHYQPSATAFLKDLQAVMAVQTSNIDGNFGQMPQKQFVNAFGATNTGNVLAEQFDQSILTQPQLVASTGTGVVAQPQARYLAPAATLTDNSLQSAGNYEAEPLITKRFFLHSAPEEEEQEIEHKTITVGKTRKNFNVVFIKAPAKAASKTSLKITPAINEDKTVIYVLDKKSEAAEVDAHIHEPATTTAKPEVFFIKYKTNEEAAHAQHTIQAQYDSLGGSTHISNEGISPVSSVIGTLDALKHANAASSVADVASAYSQDSHFEPAVAIQEAISLPQSHQQQQQFLQVTSNNGYLPPAKY